MKYLFSSVVLRILGYTLLYAGLLWGGGQIGWKAHKFAENKGCTQFEENVYPLPVYNQKKLSIVVLGDSGTGNETQIKVASAIEAHCATHPCDLALLLGDNFYPNGLSSQQDPLFKAYFQDIYHKINLPFYAILGNHDIRGKALVQVYHGLQEQKWKMPNFNYKIQAGPAEIFALNSSCPNVAVDWLEDALPSKERAKEGKWKIVMAHHTLYSSGEHGDGPWLARYWWKGNAADKVDLYLSGHDHHQEHLQKDGTDYLLSGAAGMPRRPDRDDKKSEANSLFKNEQAGFLKLDLSAEEIQITFYDDSAKQLYSSTIQK